MRILNKFFKITFFVLFLITLSKSVFAATPFVPPDDKVLLIVGQDKDSLKSYLKEIKTPPGGFMVYTSIQKLDGLNGPANHGGGIQDAEYFIDRYPNTTIQIGLYMVGALDGIISGKYDNTIRDLAYFFKKHRSHPFYLRIGYEFDNRDNYYQPGKYAESFRYIVDILRTLNVENVAYVWHSKANGDPMLSPLLWYPGDAYVDWVGVSFFSPHNTGGMDRIVEIARNHNKPIMIAEATPVKKPVQEGESTWKWFELLFDYVDSRNVKILCYINMPWDEIPIFRSDKWGDSRVEQNDVIKKNWQEATSSSKFLKSSLSLFSQLR